MNTKLVIVGLVFIVVAGAAGAMYFGGDSRSAAGPDLDQEFEITRPDVKPIPNTFTVMTPEERAAAEEAERLASEALATTTATSSETASATNDDAPEVVVDGELPE